MLETVLAAVGIAGVKFLAKKSIAAVAGATGVLDGEVAGEMAGGVMDWFKNKVTDEAKRDMLTRPLVDLPQTIASKLKPLFVEEQQRRQQDARLKELDDEAVGAQLCLTLEDRASLEFFLAGNLDAAKVTEQLRDVRPLGRKTLSVADTQFYHLALEQLVPVLIELSGKLPDFPVAIARELLNRSERVEGKVETVIKKLDAKEAEAKAERAEVEQRYREAVAKAAAERSEFEQRYRAAVMAKHNHLELFGADITREAQKLPLSVAYVSLDLQSGDDGGGSTKSAEALFDSLQPGAGCLLIRGEAGTGKSTLFRWAAIAAAGIGRRDFTSSDGEDVKGREILRQFWDQASGGAPSNLWYLRVPFPIRLRDCPGGKLPGAEEFLTLIAKELGEPPKSWIVDVLKEGRGLVLLDGIDEVREEFRETDLWDDLAALVTAYPQTYFVVSTRPEAVPPDWLGKLGFREARINPLGPRDREELVDRWHEAIAQATRSLAEPLKRFTDLAKALKGKLRGNPRLALLASNPLLCAMICALHERDDEHLPDREARLCERLCFMLLDELDRRRGVNTVAAPEWYTRFLYEDKKLIIRSIAYHMLVTRQQSVIERQEAIDKAAECLPQMKQRLPTEVTPREVIDTLMARSGMLREATPPSEAGLGTLDFIHDAFKEYLAAERLVEENADGQLAAQALRAEWLPVLLFAAATTKEGFATRMIVKILGNDYRPDEPVGRTRMPKGERRKKLTTSELAVQQRLLLALRCLPVALHLDPKLRTWLEKQLGRMFPPRSMVEAEALATTGDLAVPFLKYECGARKMAASVRALRLIGTETALTTLRGYLHETNLDVLEELAQVQEINPLEIPAVLLMVQEPFDGEKSKTQLIIRRQIVDLSPLAGLSGLTSLILWGTPVSDLSPLAGLTGLTSLDLNHTRVSDLSPLAGLSGLTSLHLIGTPVSDLSPLAGLMKLSELVVLDREKLKIPESLRGVVRELVLPAFS